MVLEQDEEDVLVVEGFAVPPAGRGALVDRKAHGLMLAGELHDVSAETSLESGGAVDARRSGDLVAELQAEGGSPCVDDLKQRFPSGALDGVSPSRCTARPPLGGGGLGAVFAILGQRP